MKALSATELRIGNLVYYHIKDKMDEKVEWDEINHIDVDDLRILTDFENNSEYKPIPLTEEWLLKFGFEKAKHSHGYNCYIKDGFDFDIVSHGRYWVLAIYTDESCTNSLYFAHDRFEYVHQFQNLYFALNGEELTI